MRDCGKVDRNEAPKAARKHDQRKPVIAILVIGLGRGDMMNNLRGAPSWYPCATSSVMRGRNLRTHESHLLWYREKNIVDCCTNDSFSIVHLLRLAKC